MSFEERLEGLSEGRYEVIACGLLATSELKDSLLLTSPITLNKQVLVQRKESGENGENDSLYIRNQLDLAGRTLHVVKGSPSILRIQNLGNEIGDTIYIKEIAKYGPEQLISMVAHGDIDYAVCDESIARTAADSIPQIDINTAISFTQFYSWAVSKQSPALLDSLNTWLDKFQKGKRIPGGFIKNTMIKNSPFYRSEENNQKTACKIDIFMSISKKVVSIKLHAKEGIAILSFLLSS